MQVSQLNSIRSLHVQNNNLKKSLAVRRLRLCGLAKCAQCCRNEKRNYCMFIKSIISKYSWVFFLARLVHISFQKCREFASSHTTHVLSVSGEVSKLHHLIAKLAENLYKFLEGADSFQMVEGNQDLRGVKRSL